ncbi:TetR/AcrR family transcriptional regulator [Streptomyces sp. NPDC003247]|uniref:TetR/AcrR family transcriptional regulator n=1 Tax=Streptomyces sp. NPDC003247 TaxID=3364677 RepID=UPI00368123B5
MTDVRTVPGAQQARSRRTHRRLLDAGFEILASEGAEALTVAAVSKRAGVASGTVYRRFGDKEGLLRELEEEFTRGVTEEIRDRMRRRALPPEASPQEAVDVAVRAIMDTVRSNEALLRVFAVLGLRELRVMEIGSRASQAGARMFREALWPYRGSFTRTDTERALDFAHRMVYSGCLHRVVNGPNLESAAELTWDDATDEYVRATQLALLGRM